MALQNRANPSSHVAKAALFAIALATIGWLAIILVVRLIAALV